MCLKYKWLLLIFFLKYGTAMAQHGKQQINKKLPLELCDRLPLVKGKATIIDFGASYCAPCIKGLIKMQRLNVEFGSHVQFVFVTKEDSLRFHRFLKSQPEIEPNQVNIITGDTVLNMIFDHITEPHMVWIDKDSILQAYSDGQYLDAKFITNFLAGNTSSWVIKWDFPFTYQVPFIKLENNEFRGVEPKQQANFYVSDYLPGVLPRIGIERDSLSILSRMYAVNIPLVKLYTYLYERDWDRNILPAQVLAPSGLKEELLEDWRVLKSNIVHVEFQKKRLLSDHQLKVYMRKYLDTYLGWNIKLEELNRKCWVLKNIFTDEDLTKTNKKKDITSEIPLIKLIYDINHAINTPFLIDESNLDGKLHFIKSLPSDLRNINELNDLLKELGLKIEEEKRIVEYLVINSDK